MYFISISKSENKIDRKVDEDEEKNRKYGIAIEVTKEDFDAQLTWPCLKKSRGMETASLQSLLTNAQVIISINLLDAGKSQNSEVLWSVIGSHMHECSVEFQDFLPEVTGSLNIRASLR
jgi:hypothetical protein